MGVKYHEKSCGMVLFREKDGIKLYLLLHYLGDHWDFPKGHVEKGENEHETAARELLEETGIADIRFVDGFREEVSYWYKRTGKPSHKQVVFFLAKTNLEDIRLSHEHKGFQWLPYSTAFNKLTFDNAQSLLKKAKEFLED
ncbi:NUDIX domain-containing protein [Candidatus Peregrinibacteria bacterium]|nr:NUDIX domain-containing protein [Candidatus Peregrinibacteria bacterium]